jgi:MFS family permease
MLFALSLFMAPPRLSERDLAPIPRRIPPLRWRRPVLVWGPLAVVLALGWPALVLIADGGLLYFMLIVGALGFALALVSLGAAWLIGRAPKARRVVMAHVVAACALAALLAAPAFSWLLETLSDYEGLGRKIGIAPEASFALAPLALTLGLPAALFAGAVFSIVAFVKPAPEPPTLELKEFVPDVYVLTEHARDVKPLF